MRWLLLFGVVVSGCTHTLTARTGRTLKAGKTRIVVAGGAVHTPRPLSTYRIKSTPNRAGTGPFEHTYPSESWSPQIIAGGRVGLGAGWELGGGLALPGIFGAHVSLRKGLVDTRRIALAVGGDACGTYFSHSSVDVGGSVGIVSGRVTIDASVHLGNVALYASPGWMVVLNRHTLFDVDTDVSETTRVTHQLVGGAAGLRLGRRGAVYLEMGYWRAVDGAGALISPAIGFEFAGARSP